PIRRGRLPGASVPTCVTVLHGCSAWGRGGGQQYDIHSQPVFDFQEQYAAEGSDWIASPSQYMVSWLERRGWKLPKERVRVVGLPLLAEQVPATAEVAHKDIDHVIYFGRLETVKGFSLFIEALKHLDQNSREAAGLLRKITFLGAAAPGSIRSVENVFSELRRLGWEVEHIANLDSIGARRFLAQNASTALAVIPSVRYDNFPYTVIEATVTPGLRLICSNIGGIPEILGPSGTGCLFEPRPDALAAKLAERLLSSDTSRPPAYAWEEANRRWLQLHAEALTQSKRRATARIATRFSSPQLPAVDICVTYYNKAETFPYTMDSLARQTCREFTVIAVDDGSSDAKSREVFDRIARDYAKAG